MQSHYEINVSLNGTHFFATHERSAVTEHEALRLYKVLKAVFPKKAGYQISVAYYSFSGQGMTEQFDDELRKAVR